ncbi:MAG: FAD-dependent catabolic D-arginine dehydrogenase DauA [Gammaproteobacteria bacterium]|nr:MAG: FAD-dependent catabolic D-arginine dehydrogenase DauA [Gammaproteobacteria bacterium]
MLRVAVVGAGVAGLSIAAELKQANVTVLETEFQPGYHSSGRSAAVFIKPFVNPVVSQLTIDSEDFFRNPPTGYKKLAENLPNILVARNGEEHLIERYVKKWAPSCPWLKVADEAAIRKRVPGLASISSGVIDGQSLALNVHELLDGHRRRILANGGSILCASQVIGLEHRNGTWLIDVMRGEKIEADVVVNAAGAWADTLAALAGVKQLCLQPKRRTGVLVDPKRNISGWPMVHFADGQLYFKPEGALLMLSPADETPSPPCDAQPSELDVATVIDRFNARISIDIRQPERAWAGLRSFVSDQLPVVGFDPSVEGFFWAAAFGGCGVQTSPAYSRLAANIILDRNHMSQPNPLGLPMRRIG